MAIEQPGAPATRTPSAGAPPARPDRRGGEWRIDTRTRRTGLRGVARARAVLEATGGRPGGDGQPDAA